MLIGGVLFVALHSVSDIGIYALLAGKVASCAAPHDNGLAYTPIGYILLDQRLRRLAIRTATSCITPTKRD